MNEKYVLVVDDQLMLRRLAGEVLKARKFQVLMAESGQRCLDLHKQYGSEIGCVLLDVNMPEMDGYETFYALRASAPRLGIIFCTSYSKTQEKMTTVLRNHNVSYLRKPYNVNQLVQEICLMMKPEKQCIFAT